MAIVFSAAESSKYPKSYTVSFRHSDDGVIYLSQSFGDREDASRWMSRVLTHDYATEVFLHRGGKLLNHKKRIVILTLGSGNEI